MRLQAAVSLLHLSTVEAYANALAPKFVTLAITVQVNYALRVPFMIFSMPCIRTHVIMFAFYF
jgi:sister-chromatid-cohesion protein PDS5